tara:strand:+ start:302 stop:991 length:690 start_codon:yes stop_codon:yes gene_type:complete
MIVSIHQPNYIPWIGFFNKLLLSDTYVVFDDVQFPRGKDYANRNQIKTNNGKMWLTASVLGKKDLKPWNQIEINNNGWKEKHLKNIKSFYQKAPYFERYYPVLERIYKQDHKLLINLNIDLIISILICIGKHDLNMVLSSNIKTELTGLDKILYILKNQKATKYISGDGEGSKRYIDEQLFKDNNIELVWQEYKHPTYKQLHGEFIPYLSILDLLFNEGPNTKEIILCK